MLRIIVLMALTGYLPLRAQARTDTLAAKDTAAIRAAVAAHYVVPDSTIKRDVIIRADTAWARAVGGITTTIVRVEKRQGRWLFVREELIGIR